MNLNKTLIETFRINTQKAAADSITYYTSEAAKPVSQPLFLGTANTIYKQLNYLTQ